MEKIIETSKSRSTDKKFLQGGKSKQYIYPVIRRFVRLIAGYNTLCTLTLKMTTTQVVETSVTVNNSSPIQDYVHNQ